MAVIRCEDCGQPFPEEALAYCCDRCGGIFDFDRPPDFDPNQVELQMPGYWRYRHTFDLVKGTPVVSLGEGNTPLVWDTYKGQRVGLKLESLNPTGSFKDRGSAVLVGLLLQRGVKEVVEDSSGNAGASLAAYAAQAGLLSRIYVPESASGPKRQQIEMYGADLVRVPGPRSEAAKAVLAQVKKGVAYASHAFLPFGLVGIATIAYELWEQMDGECPGSLIAPVGHGGLLLGIQRGFAALEKAGLISAPPYYVGVQTTACDPVVRAFQHGMDAMSGASEGPTLAEGVRVRAPVRVKALLEAINPQNGAFLSINEEGVMAAFTALARRGHYVEPTSGLVWAALDTLMGKIPEPVVVVLSGFGLKYIPSN